MKSHILGIDLGGTKVMAAIFDAEGNIISRARAKTKAWRDDEMVFQTVSRTAEQAMERAGIPLGDLRAVGIGAPGPLDPDTGVIIESANMKLRNFPLGPRLAEAFACPAIIENDVNAGTYGEYLAGAGRGARHILGVFVGTGIGGGIIADGALYHGFSKNAGEIGHIIIKAGGPRCGCGNRGCWEALASRTAMTRDIRKAIRRGDKTRLKEKLKQETDLISGSDLAKAYRAGDKLVVRIMNRAARLLGAGIGSLVNVLSPEVVVLGGGVIEAMGDDFVARIDEAVRDIAFEFMVKDMRVVRAALGDDAGVTGAAMLAREAVERA
ncbi:MAG TPA: ROK family protein [Blastocatellia bacterium]|nr:ROK family protein [Blastocatellia bacterium]